MSRDTDFGKVSKLAKSLKRQCITQLLARIDTVTEISVRSDNKRTLYLSSRVSIQYLYLSDAKPNVDNIHMYGNSAP